jgi:NAD(P)-dependent dehydrogenase (short-subunit alcohol dehydrogenase family)
MTKGAIDSLTIGLGREVAADGVRVNAVRPGLIDTEMNHHPDDPDRLVRHLPQVPMARIGSADEVAEAILWLLSDAASYVTGSVITVSGGR